MAPPISSSASAYLLRNSGDGAGILIQLPTELLREVVGFELPPLTEQISTTDAITLACALLRSQDLTPFDMAMWFSRGKTHG